MAKQGMSSVADKEPLHEGEAAICVLYGQLQECDVNRLRDIMFGSRTAKMPPHKGRYDQYVKLPGSHLAALGE